MSSGITRDIHAAPNAVSTIGDQGLTQEKMRRLGLSPRQVELNRLYAYYRTQQHDDCVTAWDGSAHADTVARASIVATPWLQPGQTDLGGLDPLPLRYRRPSVPCHLAKLIVSRFTTLLFSEQQSPMWKVEGDHDTEEWVQAVSRHYGLMAKMMLVRDLGGAMGSTAVGFKIIDGEVIFEEFDARWCFPEFDPRHPGVLSRLEVKYMYPKEEKNRETGQYEDVPYWYRRIITSDVDCLWKPQPVGDGSEEPRWADPATVQEMRNHGLGFVPVRWIPNLEVTSDFDGDPDCLGSYDYFDRIGEIDSQCHGGSVRNADPTPWVASDGNIGELKMGSNRNGVKVEKGGTVNFAETNGSSIEAADKQAQRFWARALQVSECVLEDVDSTVSKTATEVTRRAAAMYSKASRLREQYGRRGIVLLMQDLVRAARKLSKGRRSEEGEADGSGNPIPAGTIIKSAIRLPPKFDGDKAIPCELGDVEGAKIELVWPPFTQPSPQDTAARTQATVNARAGRIITLATAVRHIASDYNIEDVQKEIAELQEEPPAGGDLAAMSLDELNRGV